MNSADETCQTSKQSGPISIDSDRMAVSIGPRKVHLTPSEFRVLVRLVEADGRVLSRQQLLDEETTRAPDNADRLVDVHISAIRRKLGVAQKWIRTVYGIGYSWSEPRTPK